MSSLLYLIGSWAARHPWRVIAGWLLVGAVVTALAGSFGGTMQDSFKIPGSDTQRTNDLLSERFPAMSGTAARVVVHSEHGGLDPRGLREARETLGDLPSVSGVSPPAMSSDNDTAIMAVQYDVPVTEFEGPMALDALNGAVQPLRDAGHQVELGGPVPENAQEISG